MKAPLIRAAVPLFDRRCSKPSARALLGADHPLVRVLDAIRLLTEQSVVVGGIAAGSLIAAATGVSHALAVTAAATGVQVVLGCALALLVAARRQRMLDLVVAGHDRIPLAAIAGERKRLLRPDHRASLAHSLDGLRSEAERPILRAPGTGPLYQPRVVRAVSPDLAHTARLLRSTVVDAAGIAMTERLLTSPHSSLFGSDAERLRQDLRAINFRLDDHRAVRLSSGDAA